MSQDAKEILKDPVDITDFNATIAWAMGIKPETEVMSSSGRPFTLANKGKAQTSMFRGV
jgi:hypothetical protein